MQELMVNTDNLVFELPVMNFEREQNRMRKRSGGLKQSLQETGQINPLVVMPKDVNGKYRVLIGNNRLLAAKDLKLRKLRVVVVDYVDKGQANRQAVKYRKEKYGKVTK